MHNHSFVDNNVAGTSQYRPNIHRPRADRPKVRIRVKVRVGVRVICTRSDNFGLLDWVYRAFGLSNLW